MRTFKITQCTDKALIGQSCLCTDDRKLIIQDSAYNIASIVDKGDDGYVIDAVNLIIQALSED